MQADEGNPLKSKSMQEVFSNAIKIHVLTRIYTAASRLELSRSTP